MSEVPENLLILPNDPILHIISYLDFQDIVNCCQVCKRLSEITQYDVIWKTLCRRYWNVKNCSSGLKWKDIFKIWYQDYGKYLDIFSSIRHSWDQIESYLEDYYPTVYESLQDGLSEEELDDIEQTIKHTLPKDVRCSYRLHNGQKMNMAGPGLFGSLQVYHFYSSLTLLDLKHAAREYQETDNQYKDWLVFSQNHHDSLFSQGYHDSHMKFIALNDKRGYIPGQIFQPTTDMVKFLADTDFNNVKSCDYDDFILANSFKDFLTKFGQQLEDDVFVKHENDMSLLCNDPNSVERTGHIEVSVATCFCPEQSSVHPPSFFHAYEITFNMDENAPADESCQLVSRHWTINDADGNEEKVGGPGVVGDYPIMRPGSTFSWISCTKYKTTYGSMTGYFTMRNLKSGQLLQIYCPVFHMKCWPYQTSEDRQARLLQQKKCQ